MAKIDDTWFDESGFSIGSVDYSPDEGTFKIGHENVLWWTLTATPEAFCNAALELIADQPLITDRQCADLMRAWLAVWENRNQ